MTIADLIARMDAAKAIYDTSRTLEDFQQSYRAEKLVADAMFRSGVHAVRIGATFYQWCNASVNVFSDVPEASSIECKEGEGK